MTWLYLWATISFVEVLRFELNQHDATDLQSAPALQLWRTSITAPSAVQVETRVRIELTKVSFADHYLYQSVTLSFTILESRDFGRTFNFRLNHAMAWLYHWATISIEEELVPKIRENPSCCWRREDRTHTISVKSRVLYPIKLHVNLFGFQYVNERKKASFSRCLFQMVVVYIVNTHAYTFDKRHQYFSLILNPQEIVNPVCRNN